MTQFADAGAVMRRAVELAARGVGVVEPNPPVGAVVVEDDLRLAGEGFHERFGGPHAEVIALADAGSAARGATLFVTLEPCCHTGKTPPCTRAIVESGVGKVVVGMQDPAAHANGRGIAALRNAGIEVEVGLLAAEAARLAAPFVKRVTTGLPCVHAKWAMTLDGRMATRSGSSQWISSEESRRIVHRLRGRMDAIVVGRGTVVADDPLLTARPPGPRTAVRVVCDSRAALPLSSQLVRTAGEVPVLLAAHESADEARVGALRNAGVEVLLLPGMPGVGGQGSGVRGQRTEGRGQKLGIGDDELAVLRPDPLALLEELGRGEMTKVLVEGGAELLGSLFDGRLIDECHVFLGPRLVGGAEAIGPLGGRGIEQMADALELLDSHVESVGGDIYIRGRISDVARPPS